MENIGSIAEHKFKTNLVVKGEQGENGHIG